MNNNHKNMKPKLAPSKPMDANGFDQWSANYDADVQESDADKRYPFVAYNKIMDRLVELVQPALGKAILDVGIGTGKLSCRLANQGCQITGLDFSDSMLAEARKLIPAAHLIPWDFSKGLPSELEDRRYEAILCNYAIHHLDDCEQQELIAQMLMHLLPEGCLLIADVMTETAQEMAYAQKADADLWDEEENYLIAEKVRQWFPDSLIEFERFSYCSGILSVKRSAQEIISLRSITEDNWLDIARIEHAPDQGNFVRDTLEILARAYVYRAHRARALGIYAGEKAVGLLLVRDLDEEPACYDLQELLIDQHHQNKGYGQAALSLLLQELKAEGKYPRVDLCAERKDLAAIHVYKKMGFVDTGYIDPWAPPSINMSYSLSPDGDSSESLQDCNG